MSIHQPDGDDGTERFDYLMVRLSRSDREPNRVAGLVERLGSGDKRSFETGEQLVGLVGGWATPDLKMQPGTVDGSAVRAGTGGSLPDKRV
jgi:hypothetical protein